MRGPDIHPYRAHGTGTYFPSLSPRTIVYKGMLTEPQVEAFYPDLSDERVTSALAVVHSRVLAVLVGLEVAILLMFGFTVLLRGGGPEGLSLAASFSPAAIGAATPSV